MPLLLRFQQYTLLFYDKIFWVNPKYFGKRMLNIFACLTEIFLYLTPKYFGTQQEMFLSINRLLLVLSTPKYIGNCTEIFIQKKQKNSRLQLIPATASCAYEFSLIL
jgi:hypothetical protein